MEIVKILLPISHHGTPAACAHAAFGLAERFGASLEVLHPCPTPAERLPYATELSPLDYIDELIDVEKSRCRSRSDKPRSGSVRWRRFFRMWCKNSLRSMVSSRRLFPCGQKAVALGVLGSFYPAWLAARQSPAIALGRV